MWGLLLVLLAGGCARTEKPDQIPETASITETTEAPEDVSYPRTVILPCETHILLDSALVLDEEHLLKEEIRDEFQLEKKFKSYSFNSAGSCIFTPCYVYSIIPYRVRCKCSICTG